MAVLYSLITLWVAVSLITSSPATGHGIDESAPPTSDIQINAKGQVIWSMYPSVFFYNGKKTTLLTKNSSWDHSPKINNNGQVVWIGVTGKSYEPFFSTVSGIFFFNGTETIQITKKSSSWKRFPQINNNGQIVWQEEVGKKSQIFFFDGTQILQLTNSKISNNTPQINDNGQVIWIGQDAPNPRFSCTKGSRQPLLPESLDEFFPSKSTIPAKQFGADLMTRTSRFSFMIPKKERQPIFLILPNSATLSLRSITLVKWSGLDTTARTTKYFFSTVQKRFS
ncbi:MAG: hypothetical protein O6857_02460 [Nitrospinae bacterium]|nr:hypothetical protein [Nitrospinota bacterium]